MDQLRTLVAELGHTDVQTYVNSGNVVFTSPGDRSNEELAREITEALARRHILDVPVVVRSGAELARTVANNPFPDAAGDPKTLHVTFLGATPAPVLVEALATIERGNDDYRVIGEDVYLFYPNRISGAVFMPNGLDKALAVTATSRNWNTVLRLASMAAR